MKKDDKEFTLELQLEHAFKEKNQLGEQYKELSSKMAENRKMIRQLILKYQNMDFIGKFIKLESPSGDNDQYLYVKEMFDMTPVNDNIEYFYILRGVGFDYIFTEYDDLTDCHWDCWYEIDIQAYNEDDLKEKISCIKEITKEEYMEHFDIMLRNMKQYHIKKMIDC